MKFPIDKFREHKTPFYYYDLNLLHSTLNKINECVAGMPYFVHYAVKANANPRIVREIGAAGLGIDCVSGGEIRAAIAAGVPGDKIVYAGVGKTDEEINLALDNDILCFNVESIPELEVINDLAALRGKMASIAIRVNPNIDAHTHRYITTGLNENKFGIDLEILDDVVERVKQLANVNLIGLHFHIGSQLLDMQPYVMLCEKVNALISLFESRGINLKIINVGGGLGIDYCYPDQNPLPDFETYFDVFKHHLNLRPSQELHFELGRAIVAQCGSLITKVLYVKTGTAKKFVIVDAGMSDLIRPALYQAHHKIENITAESSEKEQYDVVGPICESSDVFGTDEILPPTSRGDLIALRSAGAYGEIMASGYNCRPLPGSVFSE